MIPVAAVDCGSNSTRLLIRDAAGVNHRYQQVTRLGVGVDETGQLSAEGIAATIEVLAEYRKLIAAAGVEGLRASATAAARAAANRDDFFGAVEQTLGVAPELLSGDEEARLSFVGAMADLDHDQPTLVVDIGGGSTEFAVGRAECNGVVSIDVGSRRLTERYVEHDPPRPEELHAMFSVLDAYLDDVVLAQPRMSDASRLVGVAGTVTTVAAVEIGLIEYDSDAVHHFVVTKDAAEDVFRTLATEAHDDRVYNPGLDPARADVIVAGSAILVAVMRYFGFEECVVSEADLLDGMVQSLTDE